ncbi:DUF533 domain-containing protein [Paracoccus suum]|uniref:DUF533 domain-containing protein n=1 Tax=Paracoccus suum TaxID=2259340 RepID=A0A344PIY2_9RHOB|nr:DUF533 domain-containing protein [Paracoccus suum]AXC49337.1 DUF533 domain-containing protein [Paracoccus suum]
MSLMKTLARVAAGVILAKGIGGMMQQQARQQTPQGGRPRTTGGGILGDLLGQSQRGGQTASAQGRGGLGDILGQVLGGQPAGGAGTGRRYGGPNTQGASGGLGGMLDQMTRNSGTTRTASTGGGGFGDLLGGLAGGAAAGGLGGVLGDLLGGGNARTTQAGGLARQGAQDRNDASFGEVFNDAMVRQDEPEIAPTPEQNAVAGLMLKAMLQAAKSDGKIDEQEKQRLMGQVGDLGEDEKQFIREQMAAPVDAAALAREVPKGLEEQVYLMSLMAIDFDNEREAQYLHALADAMSLDQQKVNAIHQQVGVQNLYA